MKQILQNLGNGETLMVDKRGFRTYRRGRKASFHLVLQDFEQ